MSWIYFSHLRCHSRLNLPSLTCPGNGCSMHHSMARFTRACLAQNCNTGRRALERHNSTATIPGTSLWNFGEKRWIDIRHYHSTRILRVSYKGLISIRLLSNYQSVILRRPSRQKSANRNTVMYAIAIAIAVTGLAYAAVPLYRIFCQASGYGGTVVKVGASEKVEGMEPIRERELTIRFNADTSSALLWQFKPQQPAIKVVPGETALAFYTAHNPTDKPVIGIATYNVIPFEAGLYFNKIQCFCFEEQRLNPHEQVDMPVFFYIDPEFDEDPAMGKVDTITLSYTFFESKEPLAPTT